jgi:hypothetical protein
MTKRTSKATAPKREPVPPAIHRELGHIRDELTTIADVAQLVVLGYPLPAESLDEHRRYMAVLERFVVELLRAQVAHIRKIRLRGVGGVA